MRGSVIELTESVLPVTCTNLHVRESVVIQTAGVNLTPSVKHSVSRLRSICRIRQVAPMCTPR